MGGGRTWRCCLILKTATIGSISDHVHLAALDFFFFLLPQHPPFFYSSSYTAAGCAYANRMKLVARSLASSSLSSYINHNQKHDRLTQFHNSTTSYLQNDPSCLHSKGKSA